MTSLRIIKRGDKYVVQIGIERKFLFYQRKTKWIDLEEHYKWLQRGKTTAGYQPFPCSVFSDLEKADQFCENYLLKDNLKDKYMGNRPGESVVKTYNTGLTDIVWPRTTPMPKCKEPKIPPKLIDIFNFHLPKGTRVDKDTSPVIFSLCMAVEAYVDGKKRGK